MKTPRELALLAARALSDKKGKEIRVLEIAELTTLADYFVLATGASNTQINALVDNVEKVMQEEAGEQPLHREGYRGGTWVLLDYGCIAVHVFNAEAREFYGLERLREVVRQDIDRGLLLGLTMTIEEMREMGNPIHHLTLDAQRYLIEQGVKQV